MGRGVLVVAQGERKTFSKPVSSSEEERESLAIGMQLRISAEVETVTQRLFCQLWTFYVPVLPGRKLPWGATSTDPHSKLAISPLYLLQTPLSLAIVTGSYTVAQVSLSHETLPGLLTHSNPSCLNNTPRVWISHHHTRISFVIPPLSKFENRLDQSSCQCATFRFLSLYPSDSPNSWLNSPSLLHPVKIVLALWREVDMRQGRSDPLKPRGM